MKTGLFRADYVDQAQDGQASLAGFLISLEAVAARTVRLTRDAAALHVETSSSRYTLHLPADFSCARSTQITLTRQSVGHIRLPPLIDQTLVTRYCLRKAHTGKLQMEIFSQTRASPYGSRFLGPDQLDRTFTWTAQLQP